MSQFNYSLSFTNTAKSYHQTGHQSPHFCIFWTEKKYIAESELYLPFVPY